MEVLIVIRYCAWNRVGAAYEAVPDVMVAVVVLKQDEYNWESKYGATTYTVEVI